MRDHRDAGLWNDSHELGSVGLTGLLAAIMQSFCVLHRISWSAPWAEDRR